MSNIPDSWQQKKDNNGNIYYLDINTHDIYRENANGHQHSRVNTNEAISLYETFEPNNGWTCGKCTYFNDINNDICLMCQEPCDHKPNNNDNINECININNNNNDNNNGDIKNNANSELVDSQQQLIEKAFSVIDAYNEQFIGLNQFMSGLERLNVKLSKQDMKQVFDKILNTTGDNWNGFVDVNGFRDFFMYEYQSDQLNALQLNIITAIHSYNDMENDMIGEGYDSSDDKDDVSDDVYRELQEKKMQKHLIEMSFDQIDYNNELYIQVNEFVNGLKNLGVILTNNDMNKVFNYICLLDGSDNLPYITSHAFVMFCIRNYVTTGLEAMKQRILNAINKNNSLLIDENFGDIEIEEDIIVKEELKELRKQNKLINEAFKKIDIDNNSDVDKNTFINGLKQLNVNISRKDIKKVFKCMDADQCELVSNPEFMTFLIRNYKSNELNVLKDAILTSINASIERNSILNNNGNKNGILKDSGYLTENEREILSDFMDKTEADINTSLKYLKESNFDKLIAMNNYYKNNNNKNNNNNYNFKDISNVPDQLMMNESVIDDVKMDYLSHTDSPLGTPHFNPMINNNYNKLGYQLSLPMSPLINNTNDNTSKDAPINPAIINNGCLLPLNTSLPYQNSVSINVNNFTTDIEGNPISTKSNDTINPGIIFNKSLIQSNTSIPYQTSISINDNNNLINEAKIDSQVIIKIPQNNKFSQKISSKVNILNDNNSIIPSKVLKKKTTKTQLK